MGRHAPLDRDHLWNRGRLAQSAFGTEMLHKVLAPGVTGVSRVGSPGRWKVTTTLTKFSGTLDLQLASEKVSWAGL
jgi:hypothetical protein